jgi:REP element-mobilizing transposase RayT
MRRRRCARTVEGMAKRRIVDPTGLYHVYSRGNFRQTIFPDHEHYLAFLRRLEKASRRRAWLILDWCLIPNHFHLIVQLQDGGLSEGMRELKGGFSRWSNAQFDRTRTGHLFQNRFGSKLVDSDAYFSALTSYVPNNPVLADLADVPEDWPWSGYRATMGLEHPYRFHQPSELLKYFGDRPETAVERYRQHVQDGLVRAGHVPWSDQGVGPAATSPT